jgi:[ribosomal protein S18]-alanine N-acetyltransferase
MLTVDTRRLRYNDSRNDEHRLETTFAMPHPPSPEPRSIIITPARLGDISAVARIQRESFRPGLAYSRFALAFLWLLPMTSFLVARDASTGDVLGNLITDRLHGNTRIINIAVAQQARRQGVGRQMLRELDRWCPEGDVMLSVEAENTGAQRLYEQEGYVRTTVSRDYYGAGRHGYVMKRPRRARATSITAP